MFVANSNCLSDLFLCDPSFFLAVARTMWMTTRSSMPWTRLYPRSTLPPTTRQICGDCSRLSCTAAKSGTAVIRFEHGPTVATKAAAGCLVVNRTPKSLQIERFCRSSNLELAGCYRRIRLRQHRATVVKIKVRLWLRLLATRLASKSLRTIPPLDQNQRSPIMNPCFRPTVAQIFTLGCRDVAAFSVFR